MSSGGSRGGQSGHGPPSSFAMDFGPPPAKRNKFLVLFFPISVIILLRKYSLK